MASPPPPEQASPPASPPPPPSQASSPTSPPPPPEQASPPASPPSNPPPPPPVVSPVSPPTTTPPPVSPPTSSPPPPAPVSPPVSPPSPSPTPPPPTPSDTPSPVSTPPPPVSTSPPPVSSPPPPASTSPPPVSSPPPPVSTSPPPVSTPAPSVSTPPPSNPSQPPPSEPSSPSPLGTPPSPPPRPLLSSPPPPYQPPPPPTTSSSSVSPVLIAGIAGGVVGAAFLIGLLILLLRRRRVKRPYPSIQIPSSPNSAFHPPPPPTYSSSWPISDNSLPHPQNPPLSPFPPPAVHGGPFTYEDLASATNGFAESNLLGQGGFGLVYRGTLSGIEVAIKKLKLGSSQGDREFRAEVEIISRIHHRNLVTLVGYCIHMDERLLVYEYVPNKTLNFHLHGSGRPTLDWLRRWKIALGSARGLAYLHEDCAPKIIHRDIKAENILLDFNFEPKVADFGLAKLVPTHISHVSSRIVGTFGYLAPEYLSSGKVTDKSDVYSYGVMLLELITGKKPVMEDVYEAQSLVDWARPMLLRAITDDIYDELIDKRLETNYDQYDMTRLIHCAAAAVRYSSTKRPRIGQIVRYLEGDISLEDLNAGTKPGNSEVKANSSEQEVLRRMAFGGIISEDYAESDQTSEYEVTSSSGANTEEMEQQRLNRKRQSG